MRARSFGILAVIVTLGGSAAGLQAQAKRPPAAADYGKGESLVPQPRGRLSPDGSGMKTPLLIEVGDGDGTVFWHQGIELYNIARRAKKDVVLLGYAGEDNGLRKKANQMDYQHRILEWFGHYLKGDPAPAWITSGTSVLEREQELNRASKKGS